MKEIAVLTRRISKVQRFMLVRYCADETLGDGDAVSYSTLESFPVWYCPGEEHPDAFRHAEEKNNGRCTDNQGRENTHSHVGAILTPG